MSFQSILPVLIMTLTTLLALLVILHTWQQRFNPGGKNFFLLIVAVAVDTSASLILLYMNPWPGLDLIPLALAVAGLVIVWVVFRHHPSAFRLDALGLNKAQLYESENRRAAQLSALQSISQLVVSSLELNQIFKTVVNVLHDAFRYPYASIFCLEGELLRLGAQAGYPEKFGYGEIPISSGIMGRAVRTRLPQFIRDVKADEDYLCASLDVNNEICVPLIKGQTVLGTINIEAGYPVTLTDFDLNLLITFATQVVVAIENARLFKAAHEQRELAEALRKIGITLGEGLNLETVLGRLLDEIKPVIPYDRACVLLMNEKRKRVHIARLRGYDRFPQGNTPCTLPLEFDVSTTARLSRMAETGSPLIIADTHEDQDWMRNQSSSHIHSWVGAPILLKGIVIGFLSLEKVEPLFYNSEQAEKLAAFAGQASIAIDNARIFTEMQNKAQKEQLLFAATRDFTAGLDTDAVLHAIVRHMVSALGVDGCNVSRWDPANDSIITLVNYERDADISTDFAGNTHSLVDYPVTRFVLKSHRPLVMHINDLSIDPSESSIMKLNGYETLFKLPLAAGRGNQAFGVVELFRRFGSRFFTEYDLELAQSLASQAAIAIENSRLYEETQRLAIVDELTSLYNRRGFSELGQREFERANRYGHPMTVLFLDIDYFKQFNDNYSYAVGDQVLRMLASCLRENVREVDLIGRYGGEEFAILLPESEIQAARTVAERIRCSVEAIRVKTGQDEVGFTISIGICQKTPDLPDLDSIIEAAGIALHGAKKTGRNRVEIYLPGEQRDPLTGGLGELIQFNPPQKVETYVSYPPKNT